MAEDFHNYLVGTLDFFNMFYAFDITEKVSMVIYLSLAQIFFPQIEPRSNILPMIPATKQHELKDENMFFDKVSQTEHKIPFNAFLPTQ